MFADRDPEAADEIVTRHEALPLLPEARPLLPEARPLLPAARPVPRPPARPVPIYRGLPKPVRILGWVVLALVVGVVVGATAPTALRRVGAVAALQPGLLDWYAVRAMGFLAYGVLAASVLYGLLLSTKILDAIAHRPVSFALHKDLAIVALLFAALHAALLVADKSFDFTPRAIIVPFASPYSPIWVGIGQLTFYATAIVTASFYVRRQIGHRVWRLIHYVTFLAFIGASAHGFASGSDSASPWAFWVYLIPVTAAAFLLSYRIVVSVATRAHPSRVERAGTLEVPTGPRGPLVCPPARLFIAPSAPSDRSPAGPIGE
jgi:sulfoxide reductase heme-binding subunit YedZ